VCLEKSNLKHILFLEIVRKSRPNEEDVTKRFAVIILFLLTSELLLIFDRGFMQRDGNK
jgi:hypothetical protein